MKSFCRKLYSRNFQHLELKKGHNRVVEAMPNIIQSAPSKRKKESIRIEKQKNLLIN